MEFFLDVLDLLDSFGTEIKIYQNSDDGEWINGEWLSNAENEIKIVNEPFIPTGRIGQYSSMLQLSDSGKIEKYEAMWISSQKYDLGTLIEHNGIKYAVHDQDDYTDYSTAVINYLKAQSNEDINHDKL